MATDNHDANDHGMWDEHDGGERHPYNYISFPSNGRVVKATCKIWAWDNCGHTEARKRIPSVYVESLFRLAPVVDAMNQKEHKFLSKCLDTTRYLKGALELLLDEGLLDGPDGEELSLIHI